MKQLLSALLCCMLLVSLAACGSGGASNEGVSSPTQQDEPAAGSSQATPASGSPAQSEQSDQSEAAQESGLPEETETAAGNALVVYFSATGNTKSVAEALAGLQGADLHEIVPEQPYTEEDLNYNDPSTRASVEQNDDTARPAIAAGIDSIEAYDVIYVGFPIWWGDMPRILNTFFDTYDFSGKVIAPFCTSGSSGIAGAVQSIVQAAPDAVVADGLRASSSRVEDDLVQWLNAIGLAEQVQ